VGEPLAWLGWVRALQSVAQAGLTYAEDQFDMERYRQVRRVAAEIAAGAGGGKVEAIEGLFASQSGYPTPKVDVRAAVIVEDRILLVEESDGTGWTMPGGWADVGESAAEAVVRETREEAGVEVRAVKLIALLDRQRHGHPPHPEHSYKAFFACRPAGGVKPRAGGGETRDARFFGLAELPPLSRARVIEEQIALAFEHHREPDLPTAFD
jgi:ADP-ribose pyrophosphatase YjhB (NUDIX family)